MKEHLAAAAAEEVLRDPVGTRRIIPCCGRAALDRRRNVRIDRVESGFRIYYGKIAELKAIEPRFPC